MLPFWMYLFLIFIEKPYLDDGDAQFEYLFCSFKENVKKENTNLFVVLFSVQELFSFLGLLHSDKRTCR